MRKIACLAFSLAACWSASAFAVSEQSGFFVGLNTGLSSSEHPNLPAYSTKNRNYVWGGTLGYNYAVSNSVGAGLEANYSNFGKTDYSSNTGSGNFENSALQLLLTGTYLMDSGFNTFVKVGAAHQQSELTLNGGKNGVTGWLPAAAAGLGYEFIQNLNVYGQYEHTFGSNNWDNATLINATPAHPASLNVFSVGVNYVFPM